MDENTEEMVAMLAQAAIQYTIQIEGGEEYVTTGTTFAVPAAGAKVHVCKDGRIKAYTVVRAPEWYAHDEEGRFSVALVVAEVN